MRPGFCTGQYSYDAFDEQPRLNRGAPAFFDLSDAEIIDEMKRRGYVTIPFGKMLPIESRYVLDTLHPALAEDNNSRSNYLVALAERQAASILRYTLRAGAFEFFVNHYNEKDPEFAWLTREHHLVSRLRVVLPPPA